MSAPRSPVPAARRGNLAEPLGDRSAAPLPSPLPAAPGGPLYFPATRALPRRARSRQQ